MTLLAYVDKKQVRPWVEFVMDVVMQELRAHDCFFTSVSRGPFSTLSTLNTLNTLNTIIADFADFAKQIK